MSGLFITGWPEKATLPERFVKWPRKKRHEGTTCQAVRRQLSCGRTKNKKRRAKAILPDRDKDCALHHRLTRNNEARRRRPGVRPCGPRVRAHPPRLVVVGAQRTGLTGAHACPSQLQLQDAKPGGQAALWRQEARRGHRHIVRAWSQDRPRPATHWPVSDPPLLHSIFFSSPRVFRFADCLIPRASRNHACHQVPRGRCGARPGQDGAGG